MIGWSLVLWFVAALNLPSTLTSPLWWILFESLIAYYILSMLSFALSYTHRCASLLHMIKSLVPTFYCLFRLYRVDHIFISCFLYLIRLLVVLIVSHYIHIWAADDSQSKKYLIEENAPIKYKQFNFHIIVGLSSHMGYRTCSSHTCSGLCLMNGNML